MGESCRSEKISPFAWSGHCYFLQAGIDAQHQLSRRQFVGRRETGFASKVLYFSFTPGCCFRGVRHPVEAACE